MKEIIVTGGRHYGDWIMLEDTLNFISPNLIIQGGASGADKMAAEWATLNGVECHTVSADWDNEGRAAGPLRNRKMVDNYPDAIVIAFPGGKGTEDCIKYAVSQNRIVLRVQE